jgi:hypothetical protein
MPTRWLRGANRKGHDGVFSGVLVKLPTRPSAGRSRRVTATSPQYLPADANCTVTATAGLGLTAELGQRQPGERVRERSSRIMASAASGRFQ